MRSRIATVEQHLVPELRAGGIDAPWPGGELDVHMLPIQGWVVGAERRVLGIELRSGEGVLAELPADGARPDLVERAAVPADQLHCGFHHYLSLLDLPPDFEVELVVGLEGEKRCRFATLRGTRQPLGAPAASSPLLLTTLGRTGSTWVVHLLHRHPEVRAYRPFGYEVRTVEYWMEVLRHLGRPSSALQVLTADFATPRWWLGEKPPAPLRDGSDLGILAWLQGESVERLAGFCRDQVAGFYRALVPDAAPPRFILEKSLGTRFVNRLALELWPAAREVFLVRDFRDMLASMLAFNRKKGQAGFGRHRATSDADFVDQLQGDVTRLQRQWETRRDRALLLRYEDLTREPEPTLAGLLAALDLDNGPDAATLLAEAEAAVPARAQDQHRTLPDARASIGRWQRDLPPDLREEANEAFAEALGAFGYEV